MATLECVELFTWSSDCIQHDDVQGGALPPNPPGFLDGGLERLIDLAINTDSLLEDTVDAAAEPGYYVQGVISFAVSIANGVFPNAGPEGFVRLILSRLGSHGFSLADGLEPKAVLEEMRELMEFAVVDPQSADKLKQFLLDSFEPPSVSSNGLKFHVLGMTALKLAELSDEVPLSSVAMTIGYLQKCSISLWPDPNPQPDDQPCRATVYYFPGDPGTKLRRHYVIYYPASKNGKHSFDDGVRYAVAHELAHIALGHALVNEQRNELDELQADFLATTLIANRGVPCNRRDLSDIAIEHLLAGSVGLPTHERCMILARLTTLQQLRSLGSFGEQREYVKAFANTYNQHAEVRHAVSRAVAYAVRSALTPRN